MIDWQANVVGPCIAVFGEPATFKARSWNMPFGISAIFDDAFKVVTMSRDGTEVLSTFPAAGVNLADFPVMPAQGDEVTREGTGQTYVVREVRKDSHGGAMLILNFQAARA
jgi:hypothetical protein